MNIQSLVCWTRTNLHNFIARGGKTSTDGDRDAVFDCKNYFLCAGANNTKWMVIIFIYKFPNI